MFHVVSFIYYMYIHVRVASSEKVDKWARYCDFQIASMPYPGVPRNSKYSTTLKMNLY